MLVVSLKHATKITDMCLTLLKDISKLYYGCNDIEKIITNSHPSGSDVFQERNNKSYPDIVSPPFLLIFRPLRQTSSGGISLDDHQDREGLAEQQRHNNSKHRTSSFCQLKKRRPYEIFFIISTAACPDGWLLPAQHL